VGVKELVIQITPGRENLARTSSLEVGTPPWPTIETSIQW